MSGKGKRQEIDLKTRYEVITFSDANPQISTRKLAEKFSSGRTQIQCILHKRDEIMAAFEANASSDTKRWRGGKNAEIDRALLEWFRKARNVSEIACSLQIHVSMLWSIVFGPNTAPLTYANLRTHGGFAFDG